MILLTFLFSFGAHAATFTIDGKSVEFVDDSSQRLTINATCKKPQGFDCDAFTAFRRLKPTKLRTKHGRNPGAAVCTDVLQALVVTGTDTGGNENTFCLFEDGSMVDNGSLAARARSTN